MSFEERLMASVRGVEFYLDEPMANLAAALSPMRIQKKNWVTPKITARF